MLRRIVFWTFATVTITSLQYLYQPTIPLMVIAGLIMFALTFLVTWSATRIGKGVRAGVLIALVALAAGFMLSQAFDVVYSLSAAPAGLRLNPAIETSVAMVIFIGFAFLARLFLPRPKVEE
ncbi:MAG: hypothetical protein RL068_18 [Actinomycetota bacterium]|jgi:uncharacterized membrane protein